MKIFKSTGVSCLLAGVSALSLAPLATLATHPASAADPAVSATDPVPATQGRVNDGLYTDDMESEILDYEGQQRNVRHGKSTGASSTTKTTRSRTRSTTTKGTHRDRTMDQPGTKGTSPTDVPGTLDDTNTVTNPTQYNSGTTPQP